MPRKMPETHLWFRQGDDRMEDKKLNAVIEKLMHADPETVCVYENDEESGLMRCSVLRKRLAFRTIGP